MENLTYEFEKKARFFIFFCEKPVFDRIYRINTDISYLLRLLVSIRGEFKSAVKVFDRITG